MTLLTYSNNSMSTIQQLLKETGERFDKEFVRDDGLLYKYDGDEIKEFITHSQLALLSEVKKIIEELPTWEVEGSNRYGVMKDDLLQALSLTNKEDE